jgi:response regulator of citrate/malate metabolism
MLKEKETAKCRLLILERDPHVRDTCAKLADNLDFDLYSTAFIEDIESVIGQFEPSGIVIDVGLFDDNGVKLYDLITQVALPLKVLFLAGDNGQCSEAADNLARAIGLHVEGNLQRPISETLLQQSLERMTLNNIERMERLTS